tara:strand:+ start:88 stop:336 length:249 start_codon:yes stop_codon:yes gene_type:complete
MAHPIFDTLAAARRYAQTFSRENRGVYVTLQACFGLMVTTSPRLHVFAPSDSYTNSYWLNGTEKPFTNAQRVADQHATPLMS